MDAIPLARRFAGTTLIPVVAMRNQSYDELIDAIGRLRVIPVVTIDDAGRAPDLASALVEGGLPIIEITLRTPSAEASIRRIAAEVPDAVVGAGSVTTASAAAAVIDAGAQFVVAPGLDEDVVTTARERGVPVIPGIATPTELMRAINLGVDVLKLFPAEVVGGPKMIKALAAVWPQARFVPTGGVTPANIAAYLILPEVLAVGGSWMVPRHVIAAGDWASITAAAHASVQLTKDFQ